MSRVFCRLLFPHVVCCFVSSFGRLPIRLMEWDIYGMEWDAQAKRWTPRPPLFLQSFHRSGRVGSGRAGGRGRCEFQNVSVRFASLFLPFFENWIHRPRPRPRQDKIRPASFKAQTTLTHFVINSHQCDLSILCSVFVEPEFGLRGPPHVILNDGETLLSILQV